MRSLRFLLFGGAALLLAAAPALSADPPPAASTPAAPGSARRSFDEQRDRLLERLRERGLTLPSASGTIPFPAPAGSAGPTASGAPALAQELIRRWQALSATRLERRERNRAALVRQLGQRLSDPQIKAELKLHATRVAELARIQFLAENARTGAAREKLLGRVAKLLALENERHRKRLAALTGANPAPSASGTPAAAPASAPSGGSR